MADEYKINVKDVDDTSSTPAGAYYIPTDDLGSSGGGSELPAVTSDDNGDVLTVVEGAWAKADPPSSLPAVTGSDNGDVLTVVEGAWAKAAPAFIVEETWETNVATLSEKASDIWGAYLAGKHVIAVYDGGEGNAVVINGLSSASLTPAGNYTFLFMGGSGNIEFYAENGNANPTYSENSGGGGEE